jgi:hypothetical protein
MKLVFVLRYAGCYLQLFNVKPTQVSNGGTSKKIRNLNSAFEKADRLLEQKLIGSLSFTKLRHYRQIG